MIERILAPNERTRALDAEYERQSQAYLHRSRAVSRAVAGSDNTAIWTFGTPPATTPWVEPSDSNEGTPSPPSEPSMHTMPPMYAMFAYAIITLDDGCGTAFESRGGGFGGSGTDWLMKRTFQPVPAPRARELTVSITPPVRRTSSARVALDG